MKRRINEGFIDNLQDYAKNCGKPTKLAKKFAKIQVRPTKPGERVKTILANGVGETTNIAKEGDLVAKNVNSPEQWIISYDTLQRKYVPTEDEGIYRPKGNPMLATGPIDEPMDFIASWGKKEHVEPGGYILQDPTKPSDIYGIGGDEFNKTYRFVDEVDESRSYKKYVPSLSEFIAEQRINEISDALVNRAALNAKQKYGDDGYGVVYPNIQDRDDNISAAGGKLIFGSNYGNFLVRRFIDNNAIKNDPVFKFTYILYFDHKDGEYNGQDLVLNVYPYGGYLRFTIANKAKCDINRILNLPVLSEMLKSIYNDLKENAGPDAANVPLPKFIKACVRSISFEKNISYQTI